MKMVNGQLIPDHMTIPELEQMMESCNMQTFAVVCEALRNANTYEAYQVLKRYVNSKDLYKKRYVLSVIFDYEEASELTTNLTEALVCKEHFMVTTALNVVIDGKVQLSDDEVLTCLEKNRLWLDGYYYQVLTEVKRTPENTERIIQLFAKAKTDSVRIAVAEALEHFAVEENVLRLFELLGRDLAPKIRLVACRIANQFGRRDLLTQFCEDSDGHVRKEVLL